MVTKEEVIEFLEKKGIDNSIIKSKGSWTSFIINNYEVVISFDLEKIIYLIEVYSLKSSFFTTFEREQLGNLEKINDCLKIPFSNFEEKTFENFYNKYAFQKFQRTN